MERKTPLKKENKPSKREDLVFEEASDFNR
jgi:hypothetical protein